MRFATACAISYLALEANMATAASLSAEELCEHVCRGFSAPEQKVMGKAWLGLCQQHDQTPALTVLRAYHSFAVPSVDAPGLARIMRALATVPLDQDGDCTEDYFTKINITIPTSDDTVEFPSLIEGEDKVRIVEIMASVIRLNSNDDDIFVDAWKDTLDKAVENFPLKQALDNEKKHLLLLGCLSSEDINNGMADQYAFHSTSLILGQMLRKVAQSLARVYTCQGFNQEQRSTFVDDDCKPFFNDGMPRADVIDIVSAFAVACQEDESLLGKFASESINRNLTEGNKIEMLDLMRELTCVHTHNPSQQLLAFQEDLFQALPPYANMSTIEALIPAMQSIEEDQWESFAALYRLFFRTSMDGNQAARLIHVLTPICVNLDAAQRGIFQTEAAALIQAMDDFKALHALEDLAVLHCSLPEAETREALINNPFYQQFYAGMNDLEKGHMISRLACLAPAFEAMGEEIRNKVAAIWNEREVPYVAWQQPSELSKIVRRYQLNQIKKLLP